MDYVQILKLLRETVIEAVQDAFNETIQEIEDAEAEAEENGFDYPSEKEMIKVILRAKRAKGKSIGKFLTSMREKIKAGDELVGDQLATLRRIYLEQSQSLHRD